MIRQAWHLWCTTLVLFHFRANQLHCTHQQIIVVLLLMLERTVFVVMLLVRHTAHMCWYNALCLTSVMLMLPHALLHAMVDLHIMLGPEIPDKLALLNSAGEVSQCGSVLQHVHYSVQYKGMLATCTWC